MTHEEMARDMTHEEMARDNMAHLVAFMVCHSLAVDGVTAEAVDDVNQRLATQKEVDEVVEAVLVEWASRGFVRCAGPVVVKSRFDVWCKSGSGGRCFNEGFGTSSTQRWPRWRRMRRRCHE